MTNEDIKKKIDNLANKLNKRIAQYTKLEKIIPEIKHVFNLLEDSYFSKFVKNGKFKRGTSGLTFDEMREYLEQLEQAETYTPTKTEAEKIINLTKEDIENELKDKLRYGELESIGEVWGYFKDNVPEWIDYLNSTEVDQSLKFMYVKNNKGEIKQKISEIKDIIDDEQTVNGIKRNKILDILLAEQERH